MLRTVSLCCVVLIALHVCAQAHVLGIDFGSEFVKVGAPHGDQSIDIVLNELTRRKTENHIAYRNGERYIGDSARSLAARFPALAVCAINQLVGLRVGTTQLKDFEGLLYEYDIAFSDRGTAAVPISGAPGGNFSAEELYSMMLSYCHRIAKSDDVIDPKSVVITIPFHTSSGERRAILDAARLSGLSVLGFMHSTTAAAFYHGMRHRGFGNQTVNLVVLDIGATHTEAGVYSFSPPTKKGTLTEAFGVLKTIAVLEDRALGGRELDLCLARRIEKEAREKMGIGAVLGGETAALRKSQFSLLRAANKAREVLSVNTKTPVTVEGIAQDRDFHTTVDRETYEKECAHILERVQMLASEALSVSGLKPSEIDAFEMMGGVARTPRVITDVSAVLGRDVDRTLNMDEAAAIGAAYYAVKLSPFYRSKSFRLQERVPFEVSFLVQPALSEDRPPSRRELFDKTSVTGDAMSITLNRTDDFTLELFDATDAREPFAAVAVSGVVRALETMEFFTPRITHPNNSHLIRVQLSVNESGLVQVDEAVAVVRYAVNVSEKVKVNVTDDAGKTVQEERTVHTIRMRFRSSALRVGFTWFAPREPSTEEIAASTTKLRAIDAHERKKLELAVAKNNLESYLFWAKSDGVLDNAEVMAQLPAEAAENVTATISAVQEWLEDGPGGMDSCTKEEYDEQLKALKRLVSWATSFRDGKPQDETDSSAHSSSTSSVPAESSQPSGSADGPLDESASQGPPLVDDILDEDL